MGCAASSGNPICCSGAVAEDDDEALLSDGTSSKNAIKKLEEGVTLLRKAMKKLNIDNPLLTPPLWYHILPPNSVNGLETLSPSSQNSPTQQPSTSPPIDINGDHSARCNLASIAKSAASSTRRTHRQSLIHRFSASTNSTVVSSNSTSLGVTASEGGWSFATERMLQIRAGLQRRPGSVPALQAAACYLFREAIEEHAGTKWLREHVGQREGEVLACNELPPQSNSPKALSPSHSGEHPAQMHDAAVSPWYQPLTLARNIRSGDQTNQSTPQEKSDDKSDTLQLHPSLPTNVDNPTAMREHPFDDDSDNSVCAPETPKATMQRPMRPPSAGLGHENTVVNPFTLPSLRKTNVDHLDDEQYSSAPPLRRTSTASAGAVQVARTEPTALVPPSSNNDDLSHMNMERRKTLESCELSYPTEAEPAIKVQGSPRSRHSPEPLHNQRLQLTKSTEGAITTESSDAISPTRHHFDHDDDQPVLQQTSEMAPPEGPPLALGDKTDPSPRQDVEIVKAESHHCNEERMSPVEMKTSFALPQAVVDEQPLQKELSGQPSTPEAEDSRQHNIVVYENILKSKSMVAEQESDLHRENKKGASKNGAIRRGRVSIIDCEPKLVDSQSLSGGDVRPVATPPFGASNFGIGPHTMRSDNVRRQSLCASLSSFPQASAVVLATLDLRYRIACICYEFGMFDLAVEQFHWLVDVTEILLDDDVTATFDSTLDRVVLLWEAANLGIARTVITLIQRSRFTTPPTLSGPPSLSFAATGSIASIPFTSEACDALEEVIQLSERVYKLHELRMPLLKRMCRPLQPSPPEILASRRLTVRAGGGRLAAIKPSMSQSQRPTAVQLSNTTTTVPTTIVVVGETSALEAVCTTKPKPALDGSSAAGESPSISRLNGFVFGSVASRPLDLRHIPLLEVEAGIDEPSASAAAATKDALLRRYETSSHHVEDVDEGSELELQYAPESYLATQTNFRRTIDIAESAESRFTNHLPYDALTFLAVAHAFLGKYKESIIFSRKAVGTATSLFGLASAERWEAAMLLQEIQDHRMCEQSKEKV